MVLHHWVQIKQKWLVPYRIFGVIFHRRLPMSIWSCGNEELDIWIWSVLCTHKTKNTLRRIRFSAWLMLPWFVTGIREQSSTNIRQKNSTTKPRFENATCTFYRVQILSSKDEKNALVKTTGRHQRLEKFRAREGWSWILSMWPIMLEAFILTELRWP